MKQTSQRSRSKGITLLEALLVTVLVGSLGLLAARFLNQASKNFSTASTRLEDTQLSDLGLRGLSEALSKSHVMKSGMLQCGPTGVSRLRQNQSTLKLEAVGEHLEFVYSKHASVVGLRSITSGELAVMDADKFSKGDIVLLTHLNDAAFGGFFIVKEVDKDEGYISVEAHSGSAPVDIGCNSLGGVNNELEKLASDESHKIFNESPTTFRADILRYAQLRLERDPVKESNINLTLATWPGSNGANSTQKRPLLYKVKRFELTPTFEATDDVGGGIVGYEYLATRLFSRMVAGSDLTEETIKGKTSFSLGGSLRRNFSAPTTQSPPQTLFPSCAITITSQSGGFVRESDPKAALELVKVEGIYSSLNGQFGTIEIIGGGDTLPSCWSSTQADQFGIATLASSPETLDGQPKLKGEGLSVGFTLSPNVTGGLDPAYCHIPAMSSLSGKLVYYDEQSRRLVTVPCSGYLAKPVPTEFKYTDTIGSTCGRVSGTIQLGRLVDPANAANDGPSLFVDDTSCQFDIGGTLGSFEPCSLESGGQLNPDKKLAKVRIRPSNVVIQGFATTEGCECAHEITCL